MPPAICPSFQRLSGLLWSVLTWRHILSKLSFLLAFSEAKGMCELHVVSAIVPVWSFQITIATVSLLIYAPLLGGTGFSPQLFVDESSLIHFVMYSLCASSWIGKKRKEKKRRKKESSSLFPRFPLIEGSFLPYSGQHNGWWRLLCWHITAEDWSLLHAQCPRRAASVWAPFLWRISKQLLTGHGYRCLLESTSWIRLLLGTLSP